MWGREKACPLGKGREDFLEEAALCSASGGGGQVLRWKAVSPSTSWVLTLCQAVHQPLGHLPARLPRGLTASVDQCGLVGREHGVHHQLFPKQGLVDSAVRELLADGLHLSTSCRDRLGR